jgi:hypothetical protein
MIMNAASLILLALVAQATPSPASPDEKARAQVLLKEGAKLYEKGALAPALEKFNQAYAEYPSPKLLFNIGQASRDLGRLAEAMSAFERFLTEATDAPADMTTEAKKSVAELEGKLGKLRIQCAKPGAEVSVDGKLVGLAPIAELIWVMPASPRAWPSPCPQPNQRSMCKPTTSRRRPRRRPRKASGAAESGPGSPAAPRSCSPAPRSFSGYRCSRSSTA